MTRKARSASRFRRMLAVLTTTATAVATLALVAFPVQAASAADEPVAAPETVTVDVLPTWQINGVVWSQTVVGNTVYVTGSFSKARPPGVAAGGPGEISANNVFAFDIRTGNPIPNFNHSFDAQGMVVRATPDGKTVFFGGDFTTVDGQARGHVVAFDVATGNMLDWAPRTDGQVRGFAFVGDTVYIGGNFRSSGGQPREELAAWNMTTRTLTDWAPTASSGFVWDMLTTPDSSRIVISGSFTQVNGAAAYGMATLDAETGEAGPWAATSRIRAAGANGAISSLSTDGNQIYGTGYAFGSGATFEGEFAVDPYTGEINWVNDCLGDTYSSFPQGDVLYTVSHKHDCTVIGGFPDTNPRTRWQKATASTTYPTGMTTKKDAYGWDYTGLPYAGLLNWYPELAYGNYTSAQQAAWTVTGNEDYVVLGGEFPRVNNIAQQGLVRFGTRAVSPHASAPVYNAAFTPTVYSNESGTVRVNFSSVWDRDGSQITYDVYRSPSVRIATFTRDDSTFWSLPSLSVTDSGLTPGSEVRYQVRAKDSDGNVQWSAWSPYITVSDAPTSAYRAVVRADEPSHYWRLDETSGTRLWDDVGDAPGNAVSLSLNAAGAMLNDGNRAVQSNGGSTPKMTTTDVETSPASVSVEAWVKTTSSRGGRIIGFGDSATGTSTSGNTDRVLYLDNSGRVNFTINDGSYRTVYSQGAIRDGQWHHVVGTVGANGMELFVDGKRVGRDQNYTTPKTYQGYWRIGADQTGSFANRPSDTGLSGTIDDVAVYPTALSQAEVQAHYLASGRAASWTAAPTDTYGAAVVADQPDLYWRLSETTGTTINDFSGGGTPGTQAGTVTRNQSGAVTGNAAMQFNGSSAMVVAQQAWNAPKAYSAEVWFKTTSKSGGLLIGFGNTTSSLSSTGNNFDRHIVMRSDGKLSFGVRAASQVSIVSPQAYNDGQWHHAVATQGPDGMKLWVDTQVVASGDTQTALNLRGYWRIGADRTFGSTSSNYISGTLDEAAVYPTVLTEDQIRTHYQATGRLPISRAPSAVIDATTSHLTVNVDGSGSTDPDGDITSYEWNFGDGTTATGATAEHTYAEAGTYTVTLKVTDATSLASTATTSVTVAPNQAPTAAFTPTVDHLVLDVDASASVDADGTIVSYAWSFGDGETGTGKTAQHTYEAAGTYTVTLTVTDDTGATATATQSVTATLPPNGLPTAAFTAAMDKRTVSVDASGSTDEDGTIVSYAWEFGDGETGTGKTAQHTYEEDGTYTVKLTVTDDRGDTDFVSHTVTATGNKAPTASFTSSVDDLKVSVDASASADEDGTISSYSWNWGDDTPAGTGKTAQHTYAEDGTYTVTLTVTDNDGATAQKTASVTVAAPVGPVTYAADAFNRTVSSGLGNADKGGAWTLSNTATNYLVNGTAAAFQQPSGGAQRYAYLTDVSSTDTAVQVEVTLPQRPVGGSAYYTVHARRVGTEDYRSRVIVSPSGGVTVQLQRTSTVLTNIASAINVAAGDTLIVRTEATGTAPTTFRVKVWKAGTPEPTTWTSTVTDTTPELQQAGHIGLGVYLGGSVTNLPFQTRFDNLWAGSTNGAPAAANQAPTAAFTATTNDLAVTVDASASTDADGTIASYAWEFGDGATATGKTPAAHTYASAGTYTVKLTVTDDKGATDSTTKSVTVTAPAGPGDPEEPGDPVNEAPTASFTTATDGLAVTVDASASTDADGTIASYAWEFGDGATATGKTPAAHTYASAGTYTVKLTVTDDKGATDSTTKSVTVTAPAAAVFAVDDFARTATNGWGDAQTGGTWTVTPNSATGRAKFAVADGAGTMTLSPGNTLTASLPGATKSTDTEERFTVSVDQASTGGGYYVSAVGRQIDASNDYRAKIRVASTGVVTLWLVRIVGGAETILTTTNISGLSITGPDSLSVRFQVTGTGTTTLKAKVWRTDGTEPANWTATTTDSTGVLQSPGYVGIVSYLSGSATAVPVVYSYDDFWAGPAQ